MSVASYLDFWDGWAEKQHHFWKFVTFALAWQLLNIKKMEKMDLWHLVKKKKKKKHQPTPKERWMIG